MQLAYGKKIFFFFSIKDTSMFSLFKDGYII